MEVLRGIVVRDTLVFGEVAKLEVMCHGVVERPKFKIEPTYF
jgi:hypothetical protein